MRVRVAVMLALGLLVAGCAITGPTNSENFQDLVTEATPPEDGSILFSSPAEWLPDQYGFAAIQDVRSGVFVLTDTSLMFLQWAPNDTKYKLVYRAAYSEIGGHEQVRFGRSRPLAISTKDYRWQTFNMIGDGGMLVSQDGSERALAIMNQKVLRQ